MINFFRSILPRTAIVFIGMLFGMPGFAQQDKLISLPNDTLSFEELVSIIEQQSSYNFYYERSQLDSLQFSLSGRKAKLNELLDSIFVKTDFRYALDSLNVYITKFKPIITKLPLRFFEPDSSAETDFAGIYSDELEDTGNAVRSSLENKLFEIGNRTVSSARETVTLAGYIRDYKTGEIISGAGISVEALSINVTSNPFGYYALSLPRGNHEVKISSPGMQATRRQILIHSDGKLDIELEDYIASLKAVVIVSDRNSNIRNLQMGTERLNIRTIKKVPVVFGEADVLKVILTLPGVTTVGEASTGFNVRGGSADQNLILFSDATIYNPSHLFGFFSSFNPDVVKGVELYKSSIPEQYGGRLSSVMDISVREGNNKKFSGSGGIGPLTGKLTLEGPLRKDHSSFIIAGRSTYSNWILGQLPDDYYSNSKASFYDLNLNVSHRINEKNHFYLTGYRSSDQFKLNADTLFRYSNTNFNIKWKHIFNNKLYGLLTAGVDNYNYQVESEKNPVNAFNLAFNIRQLNLKTDFNYTINNQHTVNFGFSNIYYTIQPGSFEPTGNQSLIVPDRLESEQGSESALYIGSKYNFNSGFSIKGGIRYSVFNYLGPRSLRTYVEGVPRSNLSAKDTTQYRSGQFINTYHGPEFRLAMQYVLNESTSVKAGFNSLRQYIHMLSNTTVISPTDIWKLSDPNIRPQTGMQYSIGLYKNLRSNTIETSVELYFKQMKNFLDFKSGASLIMNHHIETDVISTRGKAYGAEFQIKKNQGKINGWISYTYSRTMLQANDPIAGELINQGMYYPASFDKPHNFNFVGNLRFSHRYSLSMNLVYSTGRPITIPIAVFDQGGAPRLLYSERNQYRIPDYFRADVSMNIDGNHKQNQLIHNSWAFGVYNLTGRENPYSIFFIQQNGQVKGYQLSIFGTAIPFITYNFRF